MPHLDGCSSGRLPQGILAVGYRYGRSTTHRPILPRCTTSLSMRQRLLEGVGPGCSGLGMVSLLRRREGRCCIDGRILGRRRAAARPRPVRARRRGERRRCCTSIPAVLVERAPSASGSKRFTRLSRLAVVPGHNPCMRPTILAGRLSMHSAAPRWVARTICCAARSALMEISGSVDPRANQVNSRSCWPLKRACT